MDEFELVADEFTPPRGDCPRFLVCLFEIGITNYTRAVEGNCQGFLDSSTVHNPERI